MQPGTVILDVRGPHARVPEGLNETDAPSKKLPNMTLIRVQDLVDGLRPTASPLLEEQHNKLNLTYLKQQKAQPAKKTTELNPRQPLVLSVWRQQTGAGAQVLQVLPALTTLENNELCEMAGEEGEEAERMFGLHEEGGINSLHFKHRLHSKGSYRLALTCRPLADQDHSLQPFTIKLLIHIL